MAANGGTTIAAKEVERIQLYAKRIGWQRLDQGPFFLGYILLVGLSFYQALTLEWGTVPIPVYATGGLALLHVLVLLSEQWFINFKAFITAYRVRYIGEAELCMVITPKLSGKPELVPLKFGMKAEANDNDIEISFEFRKHQFIYDAEQDCFEKLKYPVKETFSYYSKCTGLGSEAKQAAALKRYGLNKYEVPVPPFMELLKEHMVAPFFVFQIFCVLLWCLDEYWYYSLFTLFMLVAFECTVVSQRVRNLKELRSLTTPKMALNVYRGGKWEMKEGDELLPGDVVSVCRPAAGSEDKVMPADCLILAGSCIVEEAVLTGESTPQWKVAIDGADPGAHLNMKQDKQFILFGGTKVLQHTGDKTAKIRTPDGGCLAVVLRTGFETAQGRLMRTIMLSSERVTANNWETGLFIVFLLFFAVAAAYYVLKNGLQDPSRSRFKLILNCVMIITSVIPPELPMELSIAVNASLVALARKKVFCTEPFRIPFAGKVQVCCFDKTGTLTSDHLLLEGLVGVPGRGEELVTDLKALPNSVAEVMATCQSLVQVGDELIGDPLETASIEAVGWTYSSDVALSPDRKVKATILHRYHFSSSLKRMAAIVRVEDDVAAAPYNAVVLKGAPEVVRGFLANAPKDYEQQYKQYAAQGARVIALAYKRLEGDMSADQLRSLTRDQVEQGLDFEGFAVFQCPLKPDSEPALKQLAASRHQLVMITGDAALTACHAAAQVHIVTRQVLVLHHGAESSSANMSAPSSAVAAAEPDSNYVWVSPDESVQVPFSRSWAELLQLASQYDLCLTGDSLAHIEACGLAGSVVPLCQVFARVSPEQKELVLMKLREAGKVTLMCGDGTNDVGGLKAAHVGVALLSPTESANRKRSKKDKEGKEKKEKKERSSSSSSKADRSAVVPADQQLPPKKEKKLKPGEKMLRDLEKAGKPITPAQRKMAEWLDKMADDTAGEPPQLKPGDASMAAPFTAKSASVLPCTDIIKQGRCTLVTTVQMFKILGLLCLSTAYSLSVMYLQGVKLSDMQATLSGMLTAGMFFFLSNAKPLEQLSPQRPHPNIFNAYFFLSLCGQFALHMGFLIYMYQQALAHMPAEERLSSESDFKPNLVNTVCYLVQAVVQLATFAVNYVGHPFNTSLMENKGLMTSLRTSSIFLAVLMLQLVPDLNEGFQLVALPGSMGTQLLGMSAVMVLLAAGWENMLRTMLMPKAPPAKGYMDHSSELRALGAQAKKRQ